MYLVRVSYGMTESKFVCNDLDIVINNVRYYLTIPEVVDVMVETVDIVPKIADNN